MKKITFLIATMIATVCTLQSKVLIVNNNSTNNGQYTDIGIAIVNASVGDTLYLVGSPNTYGAFTIAKRLTIFGAGHHSTNTSVIVPSKTGTITFDSASSELYGSKLAGLYIDGYVTYASGDLGKINNITIDRCYVNSYFYIGGSNWLIKNSIMASVSEIGNNSNVIFSNCFLESVQNSNKSTVKIINSILFNNGNLYNISNLTFENNIFYNYNFASYAPTSCIFNNNISYDTNTQDLPPAGNTGSNNKSNQNPKFISTLPGLDNTIYHYDLSSYDWHLQVSSPGYLAGTDATDIGIYGGAFVMPNFSGVTNLPLIQSVQLTNPIVEKNTTLKVKVKASKND